MIFAALGAVLPGFAILVQTSPDTIPGLISNLGGFALGVGVMYAWLRDSNSRLDRALEIVASIQPTLGEVQHSLVTSNEAHKAASEAARQLSDALRSIPKGEQLTEALRQEIYRAMEQIGRHVKGE